MAQIRRRGVIQTAAAFGLGATVGSLLAFFYAPASGQEMRRRLMKQARGLGRQLMDKLIRYLRERGTTEVVGQCLPENVGMAALARQTRFDVSTASAQETVAMRLSLR